MATDDEHPPQRVPPGTPAGVPRAARGYRSPRYSVFLLSGAGLGAAAGLALAVFGAASTASGGPGVLGYFAALGAFFGALLAGTVAVVVESALNRGRRRGPAPRRPGGTPPG